MFKPSTVFLAFLAGATLGAFLVERSNAHPPCDQSPPDCGYEQVVNPITGELEQQYVCH